MRSGNRGAFSWHPHRGRGRSPVDGVWIRTHVGCVIHRRGSGARAERWRQQASTGMTAPTTFNPREPFTFRAAREAGLSRRQIQGPEYQRIIRGVHVSATVELTPAIRAKATLLVAPKNTVVARHTAAELMGATPPPDWRTHVTTLRGSPTAQSPTDDDVAVGTRTGKPERGRRMRLDEVDSRVSSDWSRLVWFNGILMTDPVRTFLEMAGDLDLVELVVLGDSIVRRTAVTPDDLEAAAATPGAHRRQARRAAGLVRAQVDSPQESRLRMLIVLAGLPEPEVNIEIADGSGRVRRRLDLGYRKYRLGVEYEGRQHVDDPAQWMSDIARREEFDDLGWRLMLFVAKDIYTDPEGALARIVHALKGRGCAEAGLRSAEWRRYFGPAWKRSA